MRLRELFGRTRGPGSSIEESSGSSDDELSWLGLRSDAAADVSRWWRLSVCDDFGESGMNFTLADGEGGSFEGGDWEAVDDGRDGDGEGVWGRPRAPFRPSANGTTMLAVTRLDSHM